MENHHVQWENSLFQWQFSIAMFYITRGYPAIESVWLCLKGNHRFINNLGSQPSMETSKYHMMVISIYFPCYIPIISLLYHQPYIYTYIYTHPILQYTYLSLLFRWLLPYLYVLDLLYIYIYTGWCPPSDVSWFINPMNTSSLYLP